MATDRELLTKAQQGELGSVISMTNPNTAVTDMHSRAVSFPINDAATAGTAVTESVILATTRRILVKGVKLAAPIAVTAHDTTYATITVSKRTAAGAAVIVASQTTKLVPAGGLGSLVAFVPVALTLVPAVAQLVAGDVLTVLVSKASTGVALTAATSVATVTVDYEEN